MTVTLGRDARNHWSDRKTIVKTSKLNDIPVTFVTSSSHG